MRRTVDDVIKDLEREAKFMGRCGMVTTANLMREAIYFLKNKKEDKDERT